MDGKRRIQIGIRMRILYAVYRMMKKAPKRRKQVPLCVDLDGTLVQTDTLLESMLLLLKKQPMSFARIPFWLLRGKAYMKRHIAERVIPDPALLPYRQDMLVFLQEEKLRNRKLILATASDERIAKSVAKHLDIFDDVIGSDGKRNFSGRAKAAALNRMYGRGQYAYAGNSRKDIAVWQEAASAYVVRATKRVCNRVQKVAKITRTFPSTYSPCSMVRAMRPYQWSKNLLVFVPAIFGYKYAAGHFLAESILAFLVLNFVASAVYIANDLLDLESDRHHKQKRMRPFACGLLPIQLGVMMVLLFLILGITTTFLLPIEFLLIIVLYLAITTAYSFSVKRVPILDVLVLACLYVLRIYAGSTATGIETSQWLLGVSFLLFFGMAAAKRFIELQNEEQLHGRGYTKDDSEQLMLMGTMSSITAIPILMLYVQSDNALLHYNNPERLWLVIPVFLYWTARFWLFVRRGEVQEDPVVFVLKDKPTYYVSILVFCILWAAS